MTQHPRCRGWFLEENRRAGLFFGWWYTITSGGIKFYADPEQYVTVTIADEPKNQSVG